MSSTKEEAGAPQNPGTNGLTKRLKRSVLLLLRGLLCGLLGRLLGGLLLCHHQIPPSPKDMDPIGSIGLVGSMWWCDVVWIAPTRTSSATPSVSPRTLVDENSETLAADGNGPLPRVGSVASVVATTSSIAIQGVVILDQPHSRQSLAKIFFARGCGNFLLRSRASHPSMTIARLRG
jgi:hypothetical protein